MNDDLRYIFIEQIAQNIEQVKKEMKEEKKFWDNYQKDWISTAINSTLPPKLFSKFPLENFKEGMHNIQKTLRALKMINMMHFSQIDLQIITQINVILIQLKEEMHLIVMPHLDLY